MTARHYCFTGFVPVDENEIMKQPEWDPKNMHYIIYQMEQCATTGRYHWQGYVQLMSPMRIPGVKKLLGKWYNGWHLEATYGDSKQAADYCRKKDTAVENTCFEFGKIITISGQRSDLDTAATTLKSGKWKDINPNTFIKFHKGLFAYAKLMGYKQTDLVVRNWVPEVTVIIGESGCGKSRTARTMLDPTDTYTLGHSVTGWWWTGYHGQADIIIDDFHGNMSLDMFLSIIDRYAMQVSVHGDLTQLLAKRIIITSSTPFIRWFGGMGQWPMSKITDVKRRITRFMDEEDCVDPLDQLYGQSQPRAHYMHRVGALSCGEPPHVHNTCTPFLTVSKFFDFNNLKNYFLHQL